MYTIDLVLEAIFGIIISATTVDDVISVTWTIGKNVYSYTDDALTATTNGIMEYVKNALALPNLPTRTGWERGVDKKVFQAACGDTWREQITSAYELVEVEEKQPQIDYTLLDDLTKIAENPAYLATCVPFFVRQLMNPCNINGVEYYVPKVDKPVNVHDTLLRALDVVLAEDKNGVSLFDFEARAKVVKESATTASGGGHPYADFDAYERGCILRHHNMTVTPLAHLLPSLSASSREVLNGLRRKFTEPVEVKEMVAEAQKIAKAVLGITEEPAVYTLLAAQTGQIRATRDKKRCVFESVATATKKFGNIF